MDYFRGLCITGYESWLIFFYRIAIGWSIYKSDIVYSLYYIFILLSDNCDNDYWLCLRCRMERAAVDLNIDGGALVLLFIIILQYYNITIL